MLDVDIQLTIPQLTQQAFELTSCFSLEAGQVIAVTGASGAGKTTLLRCIAGLEKRVRGRIALGGAIWMDHNRYLPVHRREIAYVSQNIRLFDHLNVRENLLFGWKRVKGERFIDPEDVIFELGLAPLMHKTSRQLSGGEKQKVAIGRALLCQPKLLLLDEPLTGIDLSTKRILLDALQGLCTKRALPALYVCHYPEEVATLADQILHLDQGKVCTKGPTKTLLTDLQHPFAHQSQAFSLLDGQVISIDRTQQLAVVRVNQCEMVILHENWDMGICTVGKQLSLCVYAKDVSISLSRAVDSSIVNILDATISAIMLAHGAPGKKVVALSLGENSGQKEHMQMVLACISSLSCDKLGLSPGKKVYAQIKAIAVFR